MSVPMRSTGADCPVLAMKDGNASRAKGAGHLAELFGQPVMGGAGG